MPRPKERDYSSLNNLGIKTVIDLREDPESYEKRSVEALGMRYVNIPMSDKHYPRNDQIDQFIKLVDDPQPESFSSISPSSRRTQVIILFIWPR